MAKASTLLHLVAGMSVCYASPGYGWGRDGHKLINKVAAEVMSTPLKTFLAANLESFCAMSIVPDESWKRPPHAALEKGTHFFEWNVYEATALGPKMPVLLQEAVGTIEPAQIVANGSAVWRVNQIYELLVLAIRNENWLEVIQMGGVLGHYVGDLAQPMHATSDYDGQSIGQRGIHKYFEIDLLEKKNPDDLHRDVFEAASRLRGKTPSRFGLDVVAVAFDEARRSLSLMPALLAIFSEKGPYDDEKLSPHLVDTLAFAASSLAALLDKAYLEANMQDDVSRETLEVREPDWVVFDPCGEAGCGDDRAGNERRDAGN